MRIHHRRRWGALALALAVLLGTAGIAWPRALRAQPAEASPHTLYLPLVQKAATCLQQQNEGYEVEPNNTLNDVQYALPLCRVTPLRGRLDAGDTPYDIFRLTLTEPLVIELALSDIPAGSDYDLYLYDGAGTLLAASRQPRSAPEYLSYPAAPTSYYVLVFRSYGSSDSPYALYWLP